MKTELTPSTLGVLRPTWRYIKIAILLSTFLTKGRKNDGKNKKLQKV